VRVAKYNTNPENPTGRETLRFRFTDTEMATLVEHYAPKGDREKLRFRLNLTGTSAKLVPVPAGGMGVTRSPSGKSHPWEVGFNHRSSPDIEKLPAIATTEAAMDLERAFALIKLPEDAATPVRHASASRITSVSASDFSGELRSSSDVELLRQALKAVNDTAQRLNASIQLVDGQVRAFIS